MMDSVTVFIQLLRRDLKGFFREYPGKLLDMCILFFTNVMVTGYFMAEEWVSASYGPFMVISAIGSFGLIEVVGKVSIILSDIEGDRTISQTLIMPIRAAAIFIYLALYWAISCFLLSVLLFPFGKLLMWGRFDLGAISYLRMIPMYLTSNIFYGVFALWLSSIIKGIDFVNCLWMRIVAPLWMFGAYFYSWQAAYDLSPAVGYGSLLNPIVYIMEGLHAAALGQKGFLPFWICLSATWGFIVLFTLHAIRCLRRRLDCV